MKSVAFKNLPELSYAGNEAINTLCTNLTFSGEHIKKIMLTSCHASEGKSFLSMNIVRTLAKLGKKVVLLDCDLRKSVIARKHLAFGESTVKGATHFLAGMAPMEEILYEVADVPNLYIVPCGRTVSNSLPLVSSPKMGELLDWLSSQMDYVIVDAPPVGMLIDAAKVATNCDGILLVVNYNTVRKQELIDAQEQLTQSGCPILGTVINQANFGDYLSRKYYYSKYYYSHYNYYYSSDKPESKKTKKRK
jgi:capsular exopolysaccharide synthesis family protein